TILGWVDADELLAIENDEDVLASSERSARDLPLQGPGFFGFEAGAVQLTDGPKGIGHKHLRSGIFVGRMQYQRSRDNAGRHFPNRHDSLETVHLKRPRPARQSPASVRAQKLFAPQRDHVSRGVVIRAA